MQDLHNGHSPFQAVRRWWRSLTASDSSFGNCAQDSMDRMAHDLGISTTELHQLSRYGSGSVDLLSERMGALDLSQNEVARTEPATMQDLQRVCTMCDCHRRCARDLARDPLDPKWKEYCPNAQTLSALSAQPWAVRREW
jgi:hypothetical protein